MSVTSVLERLTRGLKRSPHEFQPTLQTFPDLSVEALVDELKLVEQGHLRGERNEPPSNSATFDAVELSIIERVHRERNAAYQLAVDQVATYEDRRTALDFEGRFSIIRDSAPQAVSEFEAEARKGRDELYELRRQLVEHEDERRAFRLKNRLDRAPRISGFGAKILKLGVLVFLFLFETIVNGNFLAKGSDLGLFGGAVEAFVFAALNVFICFFIGLIGATQLNHINFVRKLIGLISVVAWLAFAVALNLCLAHYREAAGALLDDGGRQVLQRLLSRPFDLTEINSWVFFTVGFAFSCAAFADGVIYRDPYPGYGALEARVRAAHSYYIEQKTFLIEKLQNILEQINEVLEDTRRDLSVRRGEYESIVHGKQRLQRLYKEHNDHLERVAKSLLAQYHAANTEKRKTPAPPRFEKQWKMERTALEVSEIKMDLDSGIKEIQSLLSKQLDAIHTAFKKVVEGYQQIDDLIPEKPNASPST